jgi:hypothetical protein
MYEVLKAYYQKTNKFIVGKGNIVVVCYVLDRKTLGVNFIY